MEKMPSIPEEPEVLESEVERRTMPDFIKPLADAEVVEGKEAVLKCKVAGLPYPTISWYHNSKRIEGSEERKMTQRKQRTHNKTTMRGVTVNNKTAYVLQTGMSTVWSSGVLATLMEVSTKLSFLTKWARQRAMPICTSQV